MRASVVLVVIALAACVYAQCPLIQSLTPVTGTNLQLCPQYNGKPACCNSTVEQQFSTLTGSLNLLGKGNCNANLQSIFCDFLCSTSQAANVGVSAAAINISINTNTSNFAYDSCYNVCTPTLGSINSLVKKNLTDPTRGPAFLSTVGGIINAGLTQKLNFNPSTTAGFTTPMYPANAADAATCNPTTAPTSKPSNATTTTTSTGGSTSGGVSPTTTTSSASTVVASAFLFVAAVFAL